MQWPTLTIMDLNYQLDSGYIRGLAEMRRSWTQNTAYEQMTVLPTLSISLFKVKSEELPLFYKDTYYT